VVARTQTQDVSERFEQTYPLTANGRLKLSNVNGSVILEAWDRNEIKVAYVKTADSKERLDQLQVRIDPRADFISIDADYDEWRMHNDSKTWHSGCCKMQVEFHLMVPRGASLNEIETVNGSVALSNFTNFAKISAVNGAIKAANIRGTANLSTVNGEVMADFDRLDLGSKISLETVNGKATLSLPSDASATLKADSLNGNITNDLGLPVQKGKYVGSGLYGRMGNGDVQIKLGTVNGPVAILRKNDGKSASPIQNLLTQKDTEDDWDKEIDTQVSAAVKNAKVNKQVEKTAKASTRDLKVEMKNDKSDLPDPKAKVEVKVPDPKVKVDVGPVISQATVESIQRSADAMARSIEAAERRKAQEAIRDELRRQQELMPKLVETNFNTSLPRIEKQDGSFSVKGVPIVTVEAGDCGVKIQGWEKQEVQYRLVKISDARSRGNLKISQDHTDSSVNLRVGSEGSRSRPFLKDFAQAELEIFVPKRSNLQITADEEIRVEGVSGNIEITGGDEPVNIRDVGGNLHVTNADGHVRVLGFHGEIVAETGDGMITLEGDFSKLKAKSNEGPVILTVPENTSADLVSNCDQVRGDGINVTTVGPEDKEHTRYRIGKGGASFEVTTDAEIQVRGFGTLKDK